MGFSGWFISGQPRLDPRGLEVPSIEGRNGTKAIGCQLLTGDPISHDDYIKRSEAMAIACRDPNAKVVVEIEPAAVRALLDDSYRTIRVWGQWELPHQARIPLRLIVQGPPATAGVWLRLYRIELRCEQAEALKHRCDELGDVLEQMPNQADRDTGAALKRAARTFYEAIRFSRAERSHR